MGKASKAGKDQLESSLPMSLGGDVADGGGCPRLIHVGRFLRPRCVVALVLGAAMLLSVIFWLPPFLRHYGGHNGHGRDPRFEADVIASFKLQNPVSMLNAHIVKLQLDIYEEIGVPNTSVSIISLESFGVTNWTTVVFGIWPYPKTSSIPSTGLSILRSSFMSLVIGQSTLHLTASLFGNSSFFDVQKFPGGITIIPPQNVFLLQKVHVLFNFTLNFPIYQVEHKTRELKDQMKFGLQLNSNENLYVKLTNLKGSTTTPPTIVQTYVVLAVRNHQPSLPRLKQLADNIRNSSEGNLGLNHTVFGKVKQIHLSSFLRHSLNTEGSDSSPSPAPLPHLEHHIHHYHHHHHHHHSHHSDTEGAVPPVLPPSKSNHQIEAPNGCSYGFSRRTNTKAYSSPTPAPVDPKKHFAAHASSPPRSSAPLDTQRHLLAPHGNEDPLTPSPHVTGSSPSSTILWSQSRSDKSLPDNNPPEKAPSIYSSSASGNSSPNWVLALLIVLVSL